MLPGSATAKATHDVSVPKRGLTCQKKSWGTDRPICNELEVWEQVRKDQPSTQHKTFEKTIPHLSKIHLTLQLNGSVYL